LFEPLFAVLSGITSSQIPELRLDARLLCGLKAGDDEDDSPALKLLRNLPSRRLPPSAKQLGPTSVS
jgi:hypothetical protein